MAQALSLGPTQDEWISMREYILEVYLIPGVTLNRVMAEMASIHKFVATEAMYKRKFREWGIRKSLQENSRNQLIELALEKHKSGQSLPQKDTHGKVIPWDRVRRYCRHTNIHKEMWDSLEIPERPPTLRQSDHRLRRSKGWIVDPELDPSSTIVLALYQPRSPSHHISIMISQIRDFQAWRSSISFIEPKYSTLETDSLHGFSDTAREDAALNIVNDCLVGFRHLQFGFKTSAQEHFKSATNNFDQYLQQPSMFVLYAILMLYWNACPDDNECRSYRDALYQHFRTSCEENLGISNPLTKIVQQLTSGAENVERIWSIALYSWIINTRGSLSVHAARYTAANIKLGLALALQHQGYNSSAIKVYQEFLTDTETDYNPLHGKARPTRCRLANLYRLEHRYDEAEAALDAVLANIEDPGNDIDEGILYCHSLRGQIFEDTQRPMHANMAYRQAVESARTFEGREGPLTIMYGRKYYEFLCENGAATAAALEIDRLLFESEYQHVMEVIESRSTCSHTSKNQLILLNTFARRWHS